MIWLKKLHEVIDGLQIFVGNTHTLPWRHNWRDSVFNHQPHDCLLNRLFRRRSKKTSKLRVTGLCVGNSPEAGEFPAQMASNAENVSIWWRHHELGSSPVPAHDLEVWVPYVTEAGAWRDKVALCSWNSFWYIVFKYFLLLYDNWSYVQCFVTLLDIYV